MGQETTEVVQNGTIDATAAKAAATTDFSTGDSAMDALINLGEASQTSQAEVLLRELQENQKEGGERDGSEVREESPQGQESPQEGEEVTQTEEAVEEQTKPASSPDIVVYKAKAGDKEVEIPADAQLVVRVDGKDIPVSAKELVRNYQGKVPWEEHYRVLKEDRRKFDADVKALDTKLGDIVELAKSNPYRALEEFTLMAGQNPAEFLPKYIAQANKTIEELANLSEEQREMLFEKKRIEYDRQKLDKEKKAKAAEERQKEIDAYANQRKEALGVSEEELTHAWEFIQANNPDLLKGKDAKQMIDLACTFVTDVERPFALIESVLKDVAPELNKDRQFVKELRGMLSPQSTRSDIEEIVKGFIGEKASEPVATGKVSSSPTKALSKGRVVDPTPRKIPQRKVVEAEMESDDDFDPISFNDLSSIGRYLR